MTHDPYITPSGSEAGNGGTPSGAVPPYQPGPNASAGGPYQQPPYAQQPPQGTPPAGALAPAEARTWSIVAHLAPVAGALLSVGWLNFLGPLVIYLIYKDRSPQVRAAAAGAFNFSVTLWITNVVAWILFVTIIGIPIAILLWIAEAIALFLFHIWGAVNAANDQPFKYPLQIPILT